MSVHDGHRERLRKKLSSGTLVEHELLELALFYAIPRKNTNDIAHRLLAEFGSLSAVFSASVDSLKRVGGIGDSAATYLQCWGRMFELCQNAEKPNRLPKKLNRNNFFSYVKKTYVGYEEEFLDVYFLDEECSVKSKKRFSCRKSTAVRIEPNEFTKYIVDEKPSGVILVHNHPSGEPKPSKKDDDTTVQCQVICSVHNILLCDHVIYSPRGLYSYYMDGKMKEYSGKYSIKSVMESFWGTEKEDGEKSRE